MRYPRPRSRRASRQGRLSLWRSYLYRSEQKNGCRILINHETSTPPVQDITSCFCPFCLPIDCVLETTPKHRIHPCGRHGLFRYRLLRWRGEDTPSRPTGREWPSLHEHVQHFQVFSIPSLLAHRGLCTTMWHEPKFKRNQECDYHGRPSKNRGLSYLGGWQTSFQQQPS